jgi:hypothetical protein
MMTFGDLLVAFATALLVREAFRGVLPPDVHIEAVRVLPSHVSGVRIAPGSYILIDWSRL